MVFQSEEPDFIDLSTFEQIREMDDDDNFSLDIVSGFLEQAQDTFRKMEEYLFDPPPPPPRPPLAHFLGGTATLTTGNPVGTETSMSSPRWGTS